MQIFQGPTQRPSSPSAVAIGSFDGVHLGHRQLLRALKERAAARGLPALVYTFDPPARVLMQGVPFLSTLSEKLAHLEREGIDEAICVPFTREFSLRSEADFLNDLRALQPQSIVVGSDFRFGYQRSGGPEDLREVCSDLCLLPILTVEGTEVRSSAIRERLQAGDLAGAALLLGYDYAASGVVVHGDGRGRQLGYPTANVRVPPGKLLPPGVFAAELHAEGQVLAAMVNVGTRPTVSAGGVPQLEAHALDFAGDLYGKEVQVVFRIRLRGEERFGSLEALRLQLDRDAERSREALQTLGVIKP